MKKALVIGATGQDGSYLCEDLLALGYSVYGVRRNSARAWIKIPGVTYITGDVIDGSSILAALRASEPDEVYNLAADSFVGSSWSQPLLQGDVTGLGCLRVLEAIRQYGRPVRFYQASSSEMYGSSSSPQNEETPFHPRSPYGCAKLYAHSITVNYRESYGMFNCCGILFNHESPRRGPEFVTQKIVTQAAEILADKRPFIELGNLEAKRDWGYAPEYVKAMHLMLQQPEPGDYVVALGRSHSVWEFLVAVLDRAGLDFDRHVVTNSRYVRPAEVCDLRGDASKIRALGWFPTVYINELAGIMFDAAKARIV